MTCSTKNQFRVVEAETGETPDLKRIALTEDLAKGLVYCYMDGFAVMEDGSLLLLDACGNHAFAPLGRFRVVWD
jgi:hypothetical protein